MITTAQLKKAIYIAMSRTYLKALIENTPVGEGSDGTNGRVGHAAEYWELDVTDDLVINLYNQEFGDVVFYINEGTKGPYIIKPKNKRWLRWKSGPGDTFSFAKKVVHPGIEARKFVQGVMNDEKLFKEFSDIMEQQLGPYVKAFNK